MITIVPWMCEKFTHSRIHHIKNISQLEVWINYLCTHYNMYPLLQNNLYKADMILITQLRGLR